MVLSFSEPCFSEQSDFLNRIVEIVWEIEAIEQQMVDHDIQQDCVLGHENMDIAHSVRFKARFICVDCPKERQDLRLGCAHSDRLRKMLIDAYRFLMEHDVSQFIDLSAGFLEGFVEEIEKIGEDIKGWDKEIRTINYCISQIEYPDWAVGDTINLVVDPSDFPKEVESLQRMKFSIENSHQNSVDRLMAIKDKLKILLSDVFEMSSSLT